VCVRDDGEAMMDQSESSQMCLMQWELQGHAESVCEVCVTSVCD